jgi:hypothetical protein
VQNSEQTPQCLQIIGLLDVLSKLTAPKVQAATHFWHPVHLSGNKVTPPPSLSARAPVGQASAQALTPVQPAQTTATMLPDKEPPEVFILMALLARE